MITDTVRCVYTSAPETALPTRRVFTDRDGMLWRIYIVPMTGTAFTSQVIAYQVDPSEED